MYNRELAEQVRQQGEPLTDETNRKLCPLVQTGNIAARERMITGNMPLVIECVNKFIQDGRLWLEYLNDDLISAGFLGLVGGVNNIAKHVESIENPTTYLGCAIRAKLFDLIGEEQNVRHPRTNRWNPHNELKGAQLPCTIRVEMDKLLVSGSSLTTVDLRDLIQVCCRNNTERRIIQFHEEGYTQEEIAARTSVSQTKVSHVLQRLKIEVYEKWKE